MNIHDLSEHSKRIGDAIAAVSAVTAITLSQVALMVSIVAGLLSAAWMIQRFYDRYKYGPPKGE